MDIQYLTNRQISPLQFIDLLQQTSLGARRPIHDLDCIQGMLDHANLTVTAWQEDKLVGIARSVTDFSYCCYLSDLAVAESLQRRGVGKELIYRTFQALQPGCKIILLAAPQAVAYYPRIGFTKHDSAWMISSPAELK
jgi:predicted N-acetyltransferase YhbS